MNATMIISLTPPLCENEVERFRTEFFNLFYNNPTWLTRMENTTISEFLETVVEEAESRGVYNLELSYCKKMFTWVESDIDPCKHKTHVAYAHNGIVYTWRS